MNATLLALPVLVSFSLIFDLAVAVEPPVDFVSQVKPVLTDRCVECHNSENLSGNLNLQNREHAFQKRKEGPVIVPHEPDRSTLYLTLTLPAAEKKAMPATAHRLPQTDVAVIRRWIKEGANWPTGRDGEVVPRQGKPGKN